LAKNVNANRKKIKIKIWCAQDKIFLADSEILVDCELAEETKRQDLF
jgi:hypothetical protein